MAKRKKNSLVANINRRKKAGKSRPKSRSTVSSGSYQDMQAGWPASRSKRKSSAGRKKSTRTKRSGGRQKTARRKTQRTS
jgi:hypothetical protein